MARIDYEERPLVLPLYDAGDNFFGYPVDTSMRLEFAERWRRQGKSISWAFYGKVLWGKAGYPIRLSLDDSAGYNARTWYRSAEPLDMTAYEQLPSGFLPHGWWKWRIVVEPAGITGNIGFVQNPAAPPGEGASIMAEDLITMAGVLSNLPNPFSAPGANPAFRGTLQYGYTTDGGSAILWSDPIWN